MTQSGQGEQPSAGPVREGVVLPSGGGPLPPGGTGPAWERPWGPDQQQGQVPGAVGQGWQAPPVQSWGQPGPLPAEGAQPPAYGTQAPPPAPGPAYGAAGPSYGAAGQAYGAAGQAYGAAGQAYGAAGQAYGAAGQAYGAAGQAYGAAGQAYGAAGQAYGAVDPSYGGAGQAQGAVGQPYGSPAPGYGGYGASGGAYGGPASAPPPPADEGATQYLPPVQGAGAAAQHPWPAAPPADEGATQYLPPVPSEGLPPADEGATQYIPPVPSEGLPPGRPAGPASEETRFLDRVPPASGPDAEATQYIAPVPDGGADRQPPAEFDNLFRDAPGGDGRVGSTQPLPVVDEPQPRYAAAPAAHAPQGPGGHGGHGGGRAGSRVPLLAAVGVGLAVVGVGAGALLAGGDDGDDGKQPVSATAPVTVASSAPSVPPASPTADPARQQAVELDKLLADSGSSRAAVVEAVADVRSCDNLAQAAASLRDAAAQRTALVTRLQELAVDRLPNHAALTGELTKAWQASASADNHYAAWADQVAGKNGCKKGQARTTGHTQAGNQASGTANTHKKEAARLWNAIAQEMGLTRRQGSQL